MDTLTSVSGHIVSHINCFYCASNLNVHIFQALGSLILIVLLTGLGHVDSMMNMLLTDMEDEQETAYYYDDFLYKEDPEPINSLNSKMFNLAEYLASGMYLPKLLFYYFILPQFRLCTFLYYCC